MFPDKLLEVLQHEGVVGIVTLGAGHTAVVNTWNSYLELVGDNILIPAAGMHSIEEVFKEDNHLKLTVGSKDVEGTRGPGAGFHITGAGEFKENGAEFDLMKEKFPWITRVLIVHVEKVEQKI